LGEGRERRHYKFSKSLQKMYVSTYIESKLNQKKKERKKGITTYIYVCKNKKDKDG